MTRGAHLIAWAADVLSGMALLPLALRSGDVALEAGCQARRVREPTHGAVGGACAA